MGFPFLFALCTAASLVIWFGVDVEKGRRDAVRFSEAHRAADRSRDVGTEQSKISSEPRRESQTNSIKGNDGTNVNLNLKTDLVTVAKI